MGEEFGKALLGIDKPVEDLPTATGTDVVCRDSFGRLFGDNGDGDATIICPESEEDTLDSDIALES